ncbi:MAG: glycosyltransferase family 9 protein [Legionellales bacterium]|nr:glycosyltransferase family 9 protein [Legionellales bacterium]
MIELTHKRIIISKTNQIGDVMLALPIATALKRLNPRCHIIFLGRNYTRGLIEQYASVDEFADWEAMSKPYINDTIAQFKKLRADIIIHVYPHREIAYCAYRAKIPIRLGTWRRLFHWRYCNRWINLSRHNANLHEMELDMKFLRAFNDKTVYTKNNLPDLFSFKPFNRHYPSLDLLKNDKYNLLLQPKTRGQHIEWSPNHFAQLIALLPPEQFRIFVIGTPHEGDLIREKILQPFPHVHDMTLNMNLEELIHFMAHADGLICASTGPIHIAAALGIDTLGLYAPIKPFDASRWGPIGKRAQVLCIDKVCEACRDGRACACVLTIEPRRVMGVVLGWCERKLVR